jgi:putative addiction module CopG family antidote
MEIHLRPELEAAIQEDVQRGAYKNVAEYVEHAVSMLHEQETWLATHRTEIQSKIAEGFAAALRGELLEPEQVRSRLNDRKRALISQHRQG